MSDNALAAGDRSGRRTVRNCRRKSPALGSNRLTDPGRGAVYLVNQRRLQQLPGNSEIVILYVSAGTGVLARFVIFCPRPGAIAAGRRMNDVPAPRSCSRLRRVGGAGMLRSGARERRVALLIGNSTYQNATTLANPSNDAQAVAGKLKDAGFDVISAHNDLGNLQFKRVIRQFEDAAHEADIVVVFYAGQGIEIRGVN